jgi:phenylalanine-4-hydroxylase
MLPEHLSRYIVEQDYSRYSPIDQAVWRHIMKRLTTFLATHAHPCYIDGLAKTGIEVDRIPNIAQMSTKLESFGWRAVPVSGFIPPAAFMELQAHGYLPIACDLRSLEHILYTPAPDIVHEAAGHAPILVDPDYAKYLRAYATVASKAIINRQDMDQYEAIRILSDLKEDPDSQASQIESAELKLAQVTKNISKVSEAAVLSRMNWWTAEYGLIGDLNNPKIYGAGLLSSLGEAKNCLGKNVKKILFSIDCIGFAYDITEQQPQLFVTPDFARLVSVLEELAETMAYRRGGVEGLRKIVDAETVNTVELNSGIQISGKLEKYTTDDPLSPSALPIYLQFAGPVQLSSNARELHGQGVACHPKGFGCPIGMLRDAKKCLSEMSDVELSGIGIRLTAEVELNFVNGVKVTGTVQSLTREESSSRLLIVSFSNCTVTRNQQTLFDPSWGNYDMAVGSQVVSVFGGPSDRASYGGTDDFVAKTVARKIWTHEMRLRQNFYQTVRSTREELEQNQISKADALLRLTPVRAELNGDLKDDWLLRDEIAELDERLRTPL